MLKPYPERDERPKETKARILSPAMEDESIPALIHEIVVSSTIWLFQLVRTVEQKDSLRNVDDAYAMRLNTPYRTVYLCS